MDLTKLVEARHRKHWKQQEAAEFLGIDVATLCRWEKGSVKPRPYNIHKLCEVYGTTVAELGLDELHESIAVSPLEPEDNREIHTFIQEDLTMRLLSLAFMAFPSYQELQDTMSEILEKKDNMFTRRLALRRLATLPIVGLGLSELSQSQPSSPQHTIGDILQQCAAGIAACRELSTGKDSTDLILAFKGVSTYMPTLKVIVRDSSKYRKEATGLAAQCAHLQTLLGWHVENLHMAAFYAKEAVKFAKEADDLALQISALIYQSWVYYYDQRNKEAINAIDAAIPILKQPNTPGSLALRVFSTQAVMKETNGQDSTGALRQTQKALHSLSNDYYAFTESMLQTTIGNEGITYYHQGDYTKAMNCFSQLINSESLESSNMLLSAKARVEILNFMALSCLKKPIKDMDSTLHYWDAVIQEAKQLQSRQRINEALTTYGMMEVLWSREKQIADRRVMTL